MQKGCKPSWTSVCLISPESNHVNQKHLSKESVIAVVGAGAMGAGIAQIAAAAGHPVKLLDNRPGAAAKAIEGIRAQFAKLAEKGKMDAVEAKMASERLLPVEQLADLADVALVVEAIVENLEAKQKLYAELECITHPSCLFGTNTSSISVTAIGAALQRPERLAGMHFFNPAPLMALVEIVSGLATAPSVAETLFATANAWGKTAVHAKSTPGFIVNRVARPYYAEALRMAQEGAADYATIDAIMREAGGFRMGPFELMDMIGHDVNYAVTESVWRAFYNDQRFLPSLIQKDLVDAGFLGRKTNRGFYDYREGAVRPDAKTESAQPCGDNITLIGDSPLVSRIAGQLKSANRAFRRGPESDGRIVEVDGAMIYTTDGRSATQRSAETGVPNTVLVDIALDFDKATRIAVAVAAQCAPAAANAAIGLLQASRFAVSRFTDVPGLPVMRTVAMLANEAADAVNQGVCSVTGADAAMRLGLNYPQGPLAWADRIGVARIRDMLIHLSASYGEDRYRVSPLIQRCVFAFRNIHD